MPEWYRTALVLISYQPVRNEWIINEEHDAAQQWNVTLCKSFSCVISKQCGYQPVNEAVFFHPRKGIGLGFFFLPPASFFRISREQIRSSSLKIIL